MNWKRFFLNFLPAQVIWLASCSGTLPGNLGQFAPCPDSPNCVSTKAKGEKHAIAPIAYSGTRDDAKKRLMETVRSLPRARVVVEKGDPIHVEFTSKIFRFVDDVEFYFTEEAGMIHFRSASRVGRSDLGVNRKRMEDIRSRFASLESIPAKLN